MKGASFRIILSFSLTILLQISVMASAFLPSVSNLSARHKKITLSGNSLQILAEADENEEIDEDCTHALPEMFVPILELIYVPAFCEKTESIKHAPITHHHPIRANDRYLFCSVFII